MPYAHIICMECTAEYAQRLDPWGNCYPINAYMCGHCGSREIYKKELTDEEADELAKVSLRESKELPVR